MDNVTDEDDCPAQQLKRHKPDTPSIQHYAPDSPSYTPQQYEQQPDSPLSPLYSPTLQNERKFFYTRSIEDIMQDEGYTPCSPLNSPCSPSRYSSGKESIKHQTLVALEVTQQLLLTIGKNKNMVYSPLSIHIGLGMIMAGTKDHVKDKFISFLRSKSIDELNDLTSNVYPLIFADGYSKGGPRFSFANAVWVEKSLHVNPCFKEVLETTYKAALNQVDFRTRHEEVRCEVNSWVDKETNGLINEILREGSVNKESKLVLANALYFKGAWIDKFDESKTEEFDFHLESGSSVKAPFMTSSMDRYIRVFDSFKVLKLYYKQGEDKGRCFCMCVFLPNATDGLEPLVKKICSNENIDRYIPLRNVPVGKFLIPKFKISADFEPLHVLKPLGFSYEDGDVTEMAEGVDTLDMFHKSFIEVNEEGTEAAAVFYATSPGFSSGYEPPEPIPVDFVADHPFLYLIREEVTGTIMFMGHVLNPNEE